MRVELLYFEGCPSHARLRPRLDELIAEEGVHATIELRRVESIHEADRQRFLGSPTIRIDDTDVEPGAGARADFGVKCRLYRYNGRTQPLPADAWIRAALRRAAPS